MSTPQKSFLPYREIWLFTGILVIFSLIYQTLTVRHSLANALEKIDSVSENLHRIQDSLHQTQHALQQLIELSYQREENLRVIRKQVGAIDQQQRHNKLANQHNIQQAQDTAQRQEQKMLSVKKEADQFDY